MSSVTKFFLRIPPKYSEQLYVEKLLMDVQYFANKKPLGASDGATLKKNSWK